MKQEHDIFKIKHKIQVSKNQSSYYITINPASCWLNSCCLCPGVSYNGRCRQKVACQAQEMQYNTNCWLNPFLKQFIVNEMKIFVNTHYWKEAWATKGCNEIFCPLISMTDKVLTGKFYFNVSFAKKRNSNFIKLNWKMEK